LFNNNNQPAVALPRFALYILLAGVVMASATRAANL